MLWKKNNPNRNDQLDRVGRLLIESSRASEEEIEAATTSPALFERIRASRAGGASGTINNRGVNNRAVDIWAADTWTAPLAIAWRAIPALSLVTIIALALWLGAKGGPPESSFDKAMTGADIINSEPIASEPIARVTACSVATKEECAVSTDDAVAILVSAAAKEANR